MHPRVKVYKLSDEGEWQDKGTGHISLEYMEQADAMGLLILAEENQKTLLVHKIRPEDQMYQRGEESTIITWHDFELNSDVAISFQEQIGCEHIWNQIVQVQAEVQKRSSEGPRLDKQESQPSGEYLLVDEKGLELPWPELNTIEEISRVRRTGMCGACSTSQSHRGSFVCAAFSSRGAP
ncbi:hypothetical protein DUNSADRAFT_5231 [Dunaliella salina]|uniref:PP4R3 EVH1-like domain-containing protein n=1 Tax=Dunaliella salina TaxID=3046 RepID=A0ABQ7FUJ5_DUNSA|nr:hypothetical protein DUNSADRAFT_5231 [Dunaliella salina]|eukprot:KAF5826045.1 hypothetical protein DUNSADRAFT_5231 [Dunaliella salina]